MLKLVLKVRGDGRAVAWTVLRYAGACYFQGVGKRASTSTNARSLKFTVHALPANSRENRGD